MNTILVKAIEKGFDAKALFKKGYSVEDVVIEAEDYIIETTPKSEWKFEQCDLYCGKVQGFTYKNKNASGDIFHFTHHKAEKEMYFKQEYNEELQKYIYTPIDWFEVNKEEEENIAYIFVYETIVDEDTAEVLRLYDYLGKDFQAVS